ncbi:hypothetical protein PHPALM_21268 [Phytophthora palmivora]|uniref:HTH CENPB-type domain-containing protein n=1 Tax=Phytophthora palmivora TaxID=4796 RepID=A0A2P4XCQ9_9STRA|nr:hypothetical protein PHPALM_21268 [Phytophthora palmivora]
MVRIHAKQCYESAGLPVNKFAASQTWLHSFLRRNSLSIRRRTRQSQKTPEDAAIQAEKIGRSVRDKMVELRVDRVYNADQTAINYEYLPTRTVAATGSKTIWMKSAGKDKDRVTLMVLGDSIGNKYDPFMVFKTKSAKFEERARENTAFQHGFGDKLWRELRGEQDSVQAYGNSAGWWNSELTIQVLIYHFSNRRNMEEPILLLLDEFSGHWRTDVLIFARLLNVELMAIPAGYTFACQPADISWNKPLKDMLRKNWNSRSSVPFKLKAPTRHELIGWTKAAWKSLSTTVVMSGFSKAQIIPKSSYSSQLNDSDQRLLNIEPDWELFNTLLGQIPVVRHVVDPSRDMDTLASM